MTQRARAGGGVAPIASANGRERYVLRVFASAIAWLFYFCRFSVRISRWCDARTSMPGVNASRIRVNGRMFHEMVGERATTTAARDERDGGATTRERG